jgi:D-alanyl-D-alanine carboxypeptidase
MEGEMSSINWKLITGILVGLLVVIAAVLRLTRSVPRFEPSEPRQPSAWGTLEAETAQKLQSILDEGVNRLKLPGMQAYVRTSDGQTWSGASGTSDLRRKIPMQRESVLRVGSVTKTFSAVLALKLVEEGALRLDDPLAKWFPDVPNAEAITIRQLLNHTSGIPEFIPKVMMRSILPSTYWKPQEIVDIITREKPLFTPGSDWEYSNSNYFLLGLIVEELSGKSITQLLHEQILDPLQLEHTYFIPYEAAPDGLAPGFDRDLSHFPGMLDIGVKNTSWATAAFTSGALASTADDLGTFYASLFGGKLLSPSSMAEMTTFIPASNPGFEAQTGYGLGLMRLEVDGRELVGHVGQFMGSTAIAMYAPDEGTIIVLTTNLSFPDLVGVLAELQASIK